MAKKVNIRGGASLRRVLRQAPDDMAAELRDEIKAGADKVLADMLANVARDSGDLAETIKIKASRDGMSARVGAGVAGKRDQRKAGWRGHFLEFGTKHQAAQPFVKPALDRHEDSIAKGIAAGIASALTKIAGKS